MNELWTCLPSSVLLLATETMLHTIMYIFPNGKVATSEKSYDSLSYLYTLHELCILLLYPQPSIMLPEEASSNYKPHFTLFRQILMKTFCRNPISNLKLIFYLLLRKGLTEWMLQLVLSVNKNFCTRYNAILTTFSATLL